MLASLLKWPLIYGYLIGGLAGGAVNALAAILPLWLVQNKVAHLGES